VLVRTTGVLTGAVRSRKEGMPAWSSRVSMCFFCIGFCGVGVRSVWTGGRRACAAIRTRIIMPDLCGALLTMKNLVLRQASRSRMAIIFSGNTLSIRLLSRGCQRRLSLRAILHCGRKRPQRSQGGVRFPTGGSGRYWPSPRALRGGLSDPAEVSRPGAIPGPTVIVRMKENGIFRLPLFHCSGTGPAYSRAPYL
jgi:hypothetical protein